MEKFRDDISVAVREALHNVKQPESVGKVDIC